MCSRCGSLGEHQLSSTGTSDSDTTAAPQPSSNRHADFSRAVLADLYRYPPKHKGIAFALWAITGLLGVFLLVLWLQERSMRAMAWWGGAYVMGACAVTLWGAQGSANGPYPFITPEMPNAFLFIACGMIWSGARLFHGRVVLPGALFSGAVAWFLAMQFPDFAESDHARVVLSSVVIALYAFLTAFELRRERRRGPAARWCWIAVPLLHSAVFLSPVGLLLAFPAAMSPDGLFALFAFETVIYVVGTAFVVVVLAKEHVALVHKTAAMTDLLTGLFNRRAFLQAANAMIAQRARKAQPISVLLFDLDKFKSINDGFGHAVGDEALRVFATAASANMRATDVIGRIGGEEFVAIIPGNAADAAIVANRVRVAFQAALVVQMANLSLKNGRRYKWNAAAGKVDAS